MECSLIFGGDCGGKCGMVTCRWRGEGEGCGNGGGDGEGVDELWVVGRGWYGCWRW